MSETYFFRDLKNFTFILQEIDVVERKKVKPKFWFTKGFLFARTYQKETLQKI